MHVVEAPEQTSSGEPMLSLWLLSTLLPALGSELEDGVLRPARQERQDVAQVRPRLDVVELAARDKRGRDGVPFGTIVTSAEAPVRSTDDLAAQLELTEIVVETQST